MEGQAICGTCGDTLTEKESGIYVCRTCELFFGISSKTANCSNCGATYGSYPKVDRVALGFLSDYHVKKNLWEKLCTRCKITAYEKSRMYHETGRIYVPVHTTTREIIRHVMRNREATSKEFEMRGIPREFVNFCLE